MPAIEIRPGIHWIGVNDRTTDLFEGLWPITHEGVSYNAYIVAGEQKALIDLAKGFKTDEFLDQVAEVTDPATLDYVVVNHVEPDHTGILRTLRRIAPGATILGTPKAQDMLAAFFQITDDVRTVEDGEMLSLGSRTLRFISTPLVHWPETMMTYETTQRVLFSCDGFGGYGALRGAIFDDQYADLAFYEQEALRYFVNIVAMYSRPVLRAIDQLDALDIDVIAPSHGLVWRRHPDRIVELYRQWASNALKAPQAGVTLLYGSMYGNTEEVMNAVAQGVSQTGLPMEIFDVARIHASYILPSLWVRQGVIVGAPTYEGKLFPPMAHVLDMAGRKRILNRRAAYFGSYGWSGGARKEFDRTAQALKWEVVDHLEFQGGPTKHDLAEAEAFGTRFARALTEEGNG
jgi:anaerobic nitric oxide reductase flavorubredoxin